MVLMVKKGRQKTRRRFLSLFRVAGEMARVVVFGLSWMSFENAGWLVWLSFELLGSVGFRGKNDKNRARVFGFFLCGWRANVSGAECKTVRLARGKFKKIPKKLAAD